MMTVCTCVGIWQSKVLGSEIYRTTGLPMIPALEIVLIAEVFRVVYLIGSLLGHSARIGASARRLLEVVYLGS